MSARPPHSPPAHPACPGDLKLVREALDGQADALERIVQRLSRLPAVVRTSQGRLGIPLDPHEIDDACQSTFTALWTKLAEYDGRRSLEAWAYGFAVREIHKLARRRTALRFASELQEELLPPESAAPDGDPEAIGQALQEVGHPGSEIVRLKHFCGLTFQEISERMGSPIKTTMTRYYRTLERLRPLLEDPSIPSGPEAPHGQ